MTDENHDKIESAVNQIIAALTDITEVLGLEQKPKKRRFMLEKALPTFRVGDTFTLEEDGCLYLDGNATEQGHWKRRVMAYHKNTLEHFPNILTDWMTEIPTTPPEPKEPRFCNMDERDHKTKQLFRKWLDKHPDERFFQAVRNFAGEYLQGNFRVNFIFASEQDAKNINPTTASDTFFWECDQMLKFKNESNAQSEQREQEGSCEKD